MTVETQVAALAAATGGLLGLPQQVADAAAAQAAALNDAYLASIANLYRTPYVDQVNGSDTNLGTLAAPLKTINKALSLVPSGGICHALLKSDYAIDADIVMFGQRLMVSSYGARRTLTFGKYSYVSGGATFRATHGFRVLGHAEALVFNSLNVVMPEAVGAEIGYAEYDDAALFSQTDNGAHSQVSMTFHLSTITANVERYGPLCSILGAQVLLIGAVVNGTRGHLRGRVFPGVTADAGVDPLTLRTFRSNLALV